MKTECASVDGGERQPPSGHRGKRRVVLFGAVRDGWTGGNTVSGRAGCAE